jgi:uncharacterized repeat protein (TIGR01451 family)
MRLVLVGLMLLTGLTAGARAAIPEPFEPSYARIVGGDFLGVGNGSLRCPVPADNAPTTGEGNTPEACADAEQRKNNRVNDNFFMQWQDVDSDPATYNSSSARLDLPQRATVEFARLSWAGNTGVFADSTVKMCQSRESETPAILPEGGPQQKIKLRVGDVATDVAPVSFMVDPPGTFRGSGQFYSAFADVTAAFRTPASQVTVGNVWAPKGFGCMGGWSLTLVYSEPGAKKRQVFVYDGHVRQSSTEPTTTMRIAGFRAAAADVRVGVTAYEGDWGIGGDQFLVNGTSQGDNFFVSQAEAGRNNFSVDVRTLSAAVSVGAGSAELGFATTGDSYLVQTLAFSVAVPALQVAMTVDKPAVHPGDQVTFTITVTNAGAMPVRDIQAGCATIPVLESGQSGTHTCTTTAPADDFTNTVNVKGTTPIGEVEGSAAVKVEVLNPAVKISKTADKPAYRVGDMVTFTITVDNAGDTPLTGIEVADVKTPGCARKLDAPATFTCTATAPLPEDVNTASVAAADRLGKQVTATASADVRVIHPALTVSKSVDRPAFRQGDTVSFTVEVVNSGDTPLAAVTIADEVPSCVKLIGDLAPQAKHTHACSLVAGIHGFTSTATVTGTDITQRSVTSQDDATFTVQHPGISITVTTQGPYRPGDQVMFTVSIRNTGDAPLTDIVVTASAAPDCARTLSEVKDYACTMVAPADDVTNLVTVTGKPPVGPPVTSTDGVLVDVIHQR